MKGGEELQICVTRIRITWFLIYKELQTFEKYTFFFLFTATFLDHENFKSKTQELCRYLRLISYIQDYI